MDLDPFNLLDSDDDNEGVETDIITDPEAERETDSETFPVEEQPVPVVPFGSPLGSPLLGRLARLFTPDRSAQVDSESEDLDPVDQFLVDPESDTDDFVDPLLNPEPPVQPQLAPVVPIPAVLQPAIAFPMNQPPQQPVQPGGVAGVQPVAQAAQPIFLQQARNEAAVFLISATISGEQRGQLAPDALSKHHDRATTKLDPGFRLLSIGDDDSQMSNTYSIAMRIDQLRTRLETFDMQRVFVEIVTPDPNNAGQLLPNAPLLNLLTSYQVITLEQVRASVRFYKTYGQPWFVQDLLWTHELLEKSCEQRLTEKVIEQMMTIPEWERGGPTFLYLALNKITSTSEEASRAMVLKVTNMKIRDIPGEDVDQAVSHIRTALGRLNASNKVPPDIFHILLEVFQTSTVPDFNEFFKSIGNAHRQKLIPEAQVSADALLAHAENTYREMREGNKWTGIPAGVSNFNVSLSGGADTIIGMCWNCGEKGHKVDACSKPPNHTLQAQYRKAYSDARAAGTLSGRGGGRGGRGGRGGYHAGRGSGSVTSGSGEAKPWHPTSRAETMGLINGTMHFWCHKCGAMRPDHNTKTHDVAMLSSTSVPTPVFPSTSQSVSSVSGGASTATTQSATSGPSVTTPIPTPNAHFAAPSAVFHDRFGQQLSAPSDPYASMGN